MGAQGPPNHKKVVEITKKSKLGISRKFHEILGNLPLCAKSAISAANVPSIIKTHFGSVAVFARWRKKVPVLRNFLIFMEILGFHEISRIHDICDFHGTFGFCAPGRPLAGTSLPPPGFLIILFPGIPYSGGRGVSIPGSPLLRLLSSN